LLAANQLTLLSQKQVQNQIYEAKNLSQKIDNLLQQLILQIKFEITSKYKNIASLINNQIRLNYLEIPNLKRLGLQIQLQIQNELQACKSNFNQIYNQNLQKFKQIQSEVDIVFEKIQLFNPETILQKGYALIWQNQKVVETGKQLETDQAFEIQFKDQKITIQKYAESKK
jgi:exonuclease VII large subunit